MRLTKIEFSGFRRLYSATCNTDARLVAFLGPNEAGKSSVLNGLQWYFDGQALGSKDRSRHAKPANDDLVVEVTYRLTDEDLKALGDLVNEIEDQPATIECGRRASGEFTMDVSPEIRRRRAPFAAAQNAIAAVQSLLAKGEVDSALVDTDNLASALVSSNDQLASPDTTWSGESSAVSAAIDALSAALAVRVDDESEPELLPWSETFSVSVESLAEALRVNQADHPAVKVREILWSFRPSFLSFMPEDRDLLHEYNLADEALRAAPPRALVNVLRVAGTSVDELWSAIQDEDRSAFRTLESQINTNLRMRVTPSWRQSQLTLELNVNADGLIEVLVQDLDTADAPPRVVINERSDGLRTFLALSCFLGARDLARPPILLIDEVETHLHLDAQADLISLLASDAEIGQVLYTTHSPGALPLDLGTGLRFVSRSPTDPQTSLLTNSFWNKNSPGFSRLLFAMGAGAAAFSAFRRAVICEGASEMILLPTLFRIAREGREVEFQVAPGLSSAANVDPALRGIAVDTAFLVDGDSSGDQLAADLAEAGYDKDDVFHLPVDSAIEDLIERDTYLDIVQELMVESGSTAVLDREAFDATRSIASAVDLWAKQKDTKVPGHVLTSVRLAAEPERIKLTPSGAAALRSLYDGLMLRLTPKAP